MAETTLENKVAEIQRYETLAKWVMDETMRACNDKASEFNQMKIDAEPRLAASMTNHGPLQANLWVIKENTASSYLEFVNQQRLFFETQKNSLPPVFLNPPIPVPTVPAGCDPEVQMAADALSAFVTELKDSIQYEEFLRS